MTSARSFLAALALLALPLAAACGAAPIGLPAPDQPPGPLPVPAQAQIAQSERPRIQNPAASPDDLAELARGNAAFALDLYQVLRAEDGNLFFSPYSISLALAMTYAGAAGETAAQMAEALHFTLPPDRLHPAFNAYGLDLQARAQAPDEGTPFELSIANSIWGQQGYPFLPTFLDALAEHYGAGLRLVDFAADPEAARLAINDWVSDETRERIQDLIPAGAIHDLTRMVLANAIYFKAGWLHTFSEAATSPQAFHLLDGGTVEAPMMRQQETFGYALRDGYAALELPYASGGASMLILLPDSGRFEGFERALSAELIEDLRRGLTRGTVNLTLPRFTYESEFSLEQALRALGMAEAFEAGEADFSAMDGSRELFIGSVVHKAFVAVDERGTEAAAATAVMMEAMSAAPTEPVTITVDRPFIYLILDRQSGTILFLGRVLNPLG